MNIRNFIGASSFILLAWLGVTYFYQVPFERYPKQDRAGSTASVKPPQPDEEMIAITEAGQSENH